MWPGSRHRPPLGNENYSPNTSQRGNCYFIRSNRFAEDWLHPSLTTTRGTINLPGTRRNVVLAGQATARYLENNGSLKFIPLLPIYLSKPKMLSIKGYGAFRIVCQPRFAGSILNLTELVEAQTVIRGTLRRKGYSEAWNLIGKSWVSPTIPLQYS
jgi:hypothetical protein